MKPSEVSIITSPFGRSRVSFQDGYSETSLYGFSSHLGIMGGTFIGSMGETRNEKKIENGFLMVNTTVSRHRARLNLRLILP